MTNVRNILVPVDFSPGSFAAVRHAHDLAARFDSRLHLLHVAATPDAPRWAVDLFSDHLDPLLEQDRIKSLDQLATMIVAHHLDPFRTTGVVRSGSAAQVITDYADEIHADLIVMGVHGDHFIPRLRVGEVIEEVLGVAPCPVLAVPEDRREALHLPSHDTTYARLAS